MIIVLRLLMPSWFLSGLRAISRELFIFDVRHVCDVTVVALPYKANIVPTGID